MLQPDWSEFTTMAQVKMYTTLHFKCAHNSEVSLVSNHWGRSRGGRHISLAQVYMALRSSSVFASDQSSPRRLYLTFWTLRYTRYRANKSTGHLLRPVHCIHLLRYELRKGWITWAKHTWHAVYFLFPIPPPFYYLWSQHATRAPCFSDVNMLALSAVVWQHSRDLLSQSWK